MIDKNKDVVHYNSKVGAHSVSKRVHYNAPQTIKETIYKTKEEEEKELLWKVKQYKMGMTAKTMLGIIMSISVFFLRIT